MGVCLSRAHKRNGKFAQLKKTVAISLDFLDTFCVKTKGMRQSFTPNINRQQITKTANEINFKLLHRGGKKVFLPSHGKPLI